MNILNYLLIKESFADQLKNELQDIINMFEEFFLMIKEVTYDVLVNWVGGDITNMFLVGIGALAIMLIALAVINK